MKVRVSHIDYYLPVKKESSENLLQDNPGWNIGEIESKTGVKTRYISASNETAADLVVGAAKKLFSQGISKEKIDGLIFVTQSPDYALPASSCLIQERLSLSKQCAAFDLNQGCSGFIYGLAVGSSVIESGIANQVLLLCGDTYSKYITKTDRTCRPLFSDAGVAILLEKTSGDSIGPFELGTDGSGAENLIVRGTGSRIFPRNSLFMDGSKVFMFTIDAVPKCISRLLQKAEKTLDNVDHVIFHQASELVIDNLVRHLGLPSQKVFRNYEHMGNTVSATIPIALKEASDRGIVEKGDTVLLVGFGVGYSWGACLIKW